MIDIFGSFLVCVLVGAIWGVTNVFIKRCTTDITKVTGRTRIEQFLNEIKYLITNWQHVSLFLTNQIGSVIFYFLLVNSQMSFVIPVANSITFVFTAIASVIVGEAVPSKKSILGSFLIIAGISLCVIDKL